VRPHYPGLPQLFILQPEFALDISGVSDDVRERLAFALFNAAISAE
jgi:hypothetical protein